jgi:hypothetical protein
MNANLPVIPSALLSLLREAMGLPLSAHTDGGCDEFIRQPFGIQNALADATLTSLQDCCGRDHHWITLVRLAP